LADDARADAVRSAPSREHGGTILTTITQPSDNYTNDHEHDEPGGDLQK
jgi:hypothetical protein